MARYLVEAKVPAELHKLFASFAEANGFSHSEACRVLLARGLYRESTDDPSDIDEAAFMAAYWNAMTAIAGQLSIHFAPDGPFIAGFQSTVRAIARRMGVDSF